LHAKFAQYDSGLTAMQTQVQQNAACILHIESWKMMELEVWKQNLADQVKHLEEAIEDESSRCNWNIATPSTSWTSRAHWYTSWSLS